MSECLAVRRGARRVGVAVVCGGGRGRHRPSRDRGRRTELPRRSFVRPAGVAAALLACLAILFTTLYRRERPRASAREKAQTSSEVRSRARAASQGNTVNAVGVLPRYTQLPSNGPALMHAPESMARESEISGVVLDAIGGPIAGARISARGAAAGSELDVTSISAGSGEFRLRLPMGSCQVSVEAEGYARVLHELYSPARDVRLLLSPESAIVGRVVSEAEQQPVAGVTVTAKKSDGPPYSLLSSVSDATGAFALRQLPAGTHHLEALSPAFRGERISVDVGAADTVTGIELKVTSATTVRGAIRAGGAGCAAGILEISGPVALISTADAAGKVEVQGVPPGSYELTATCPSALPFRELLVVGNGPISRSWELETGIVVRGSVETAAGRPLADAVITWTRGGEATQDGAAPARPAQESSCVSDVHGEFVCSGLEPGHYAGALHVQGKLQSAAPELHLQGPMGSARIQVRADASGTIRVNVDDGTNAPGAAIAVFACSRQGAPLLAQREGQGFLLTGLPLGTYGVHLGSGECTGAIEAPLTLERDGQVVNVTLTPPPLAGVRGRLLDSAGAPVPDAWVRASDPHPAWALLLEGAPAVMTDAEGEFSVSGLLPGRYEVLAYAGSHAARQSVELAPGDELELRLVLERRAPSETPSPPLGRHAIDNTR